jgi:8-oxo-dGTP pyrophosphatase MutT (NUDIX family)
MNVNKVPRNFQKVSGRAWPKVKNMKERQVVRAVVVDVHGRILLFHSRDRSRPESGEWWELPGGGLDPSETHVDAIIRELAEEAGLIVTADQVGAAT